MIQREKCSICSALWSYLPIGADRLVLAEPVVNFK